MYIFIRITSGHVTGLCTNRLYQSVSLKLAMEAILLIGLDYPGGSRAADSILILDDLGIMVSFDRLKH